jgi:hypothetical protein
VYKYRVPPTETWPLARVLTRPTVLRLLQPLFALFAADDDAKLR